MGLEVRGVTIFSLGEWRDLARSYRDPDVEVPPVLVAWSLGKVVEPFDVYVALNVPARMAPGATGRTHELLDLASSRLERAFPGETGTSQDEEPLGGSHL